MKTRFHLPRTLSALALLAATTGFAPAQSPVGSWDVAVKGSGKDASYTGTGSLRFYANGTLSGSQTLDATAKTTKSNPRGTATTGRNNDSTNATIEVPTPPVNPLDAINGFAGLFGTWTADAKGKVTGVMYSVTGTGGATKTNAISFTGSAKKGKLKLNGQSALLGTTAYSGAEYTAVFGEPSGVALDNEATRVFVADPANNAVHLLDLGDNSINPFLDASSGLNRPVAVGTDDQDNLYVVNKGFGSNSGSVIEYDRFGNRLGVRSGTPLNSPTAILVKPRGELFVAEQGGRVLRIRTNAPQEVIVTVPNSRLQGIAEFDDGILVVSDAANHVLWQINPDTHAVSLFTGALHVPGKTLGGTNFAKFNQPQGLVRAAGNVVVVADSGNNRLVVVNRTGESTNVINAASSIVWLGQQGDPVGANASRFLPMIAPVGVTLAGNGSLFTAEGQSDLVRSISGTGLQLPPFQTPLPPLPAPRVGWVDFVDDPIHGPISVLRTVSPFTFNNDVIIAIDGTDGTQTLYTQGATSTGVDTVQDPGPGNPASSTPWPYHDGMTISEVPPTIATTAPHVTVKAISTQAEREDSPIVTARFNFVTANPIITGDNAASFAITNVTVGAQMFYTTDGTDPTTNGATTIGPISSGMALSIRTTNDFTFKIQAFRDKYSPSAVVEKHFSLTNFAANKIVFGFASGEASSDFIGSAGQVFYAPVTLEPLTSTRIYSLQFNVTVTNAGPNPGPVTGAGEFGFESMLIKPRPNTTPVVYETIPPYMIADGLTNPPPADLVVDYDHQSFVNLVFTNVSNNLLGVGWLERFGRTNLYDTTKQDLITFSMAHDTVFESKGGKVVLGGYGFRIPPAATGGQTYQIQIGRPSATSDGIGRPGSSVFIDTPTNGSFGAGAINAIKNVTVGQRKYLVGDAAPFRWFNAGDFGDTNLLNDDVMQTFQSAIYGFNSPPEGSDLKDCLDSCGALAADSGNGYLVKGAVVTAPGALNALFDGNDTTINGIAFGDGVLDVCDVYVTFRRSLDPSLLLFRRFWTNGSAAGEAVLQATAPRPAFIPQPRSGVTNPPSVTFVAGDVIGSAGQTVQIPITATIAGEFPLRVLMLNLTVEPVDGSPALTVPVQFAPSPALGSPSRTISEEKGNFAGAWLDSNIAGLTGKAVIGTLTVTLPGTASTTAAYVVHFDHVSGSPNGLAAIPAHSINGVLTLSDRSASTFGDGIPDAWRFRYFGTLSSQLSQAGADPDGDGANNWQEFVAGTDPLTK